MAEGALEVAAKDPNDRVVAVLSPDQTLCQVEEAPMMVQPFYVHLVSESVGGVVLALQAPIFFRSRLRAIYSDVAADPEVVNPDQLDNVITMI